jgi:hypothetical protein
MTSKQNDARLKRVLDTRLDSALLDTLSTLSQVFATGEDGAPLATPAIPRSAVGLRVEFDKRSLQVAQAFLARLAPLEGHVRALSGAVDGVAGACAAALARAEQDERVSAAFLAAAAETARRKALVQADVARLRELSAQYALRGEDVRALEEGPEALSGAFFEALERVGAIRARALLMVGGASADGVCSSSSSSSGGGGGLGSGGGGGGGTASEHALGLELLESATAAQGSALSRLFDWCLARCRQADVLQLAAAEGEDDEVAAAELRERQAVLGPSAGGGGGGAPVLDRALRRGLALLAATRPGFCRACQEAAMGCRRAAFVRAFVTALSSGSAGALGEAVGSGASGGGGGGGRRAIDANAHDSLRYVSDLCAWVHLNSAEEAEALATIFRAAAAAAAPPPPAEPLPSPDDAAALEASRLLSTAEMVTAVCDGLARPLTLRVEQVITSASTTLPVAIRLVDVLAFYVRTLGELLAPASSLLAGLSGAHARAALRVEELLQLTARRLAEAPPAYPSSLSATPIVTDTVALLEDVLAAAATPLLPGGEGAPAIDVGRVLELLIEPLLAGCRASAAGLRLLDTATFLCNQVSALQTALAPYAAAARAVQRLAAEMSTYEENMVQTLSEEVLSDVGLLPKLTALRSQPPGARLADVPGLKPEQLRAAAGAFVAELSSRHGTGPLVSFDRIDNPRIRSRLRRDAAALLFEAYALLAKAVADPASGYGGATGAAELLPARENVAVLLDVT